MSLLACTLIFLVHSVCAQQQDLSELVTRKCPESGGQVAADCYGNVVFQVMKGIKGGNEAMDIPALEPLLPGTLNVSVSAGSDQTGNPLSLVLNAKKVIMKSPYVNSGRLILIQASGGGVMSNTFDDAKITIKMAYDQPEIKDGKRYGHVKDCKVTFTSGTTNMRVEKLNSGNEIARELYNVFLSASSTEIMNLMLPQLNSQLADLFCDVTNKVLKKLPLDAVFE
ncbi:hypothetical protein B566_EDAN003952 [Ephemera danica]|nr:hypothetical protein B566_EDAN003952 [Ephemera danica]